MPYDSTRGAYYACMVQHSIPIDPRVVDAALPQNPTAALAARLPKRPVTATISIQEGWDLVGQYHEQLIKAGVEPHQALALVAKAFPTVYAAWAR
jgi:hypothetical protein